MVTKPSSKGKLSKKAAPAKSSDRSPAIEPASQSDEHRIRERAYGIWIEEGRPHGRDLAHWQRASRELQHEAR
jgi:Protein of unknown function (DUF2934)